MRIVEILVPEFSESISEGTLMQWRKKVGDFVAVGEALVEIETEKVVLEVPATIAGQLIEMLAEEGATVTSGAVIAKIDATAVAAEPVLVAKASESDKIPAPTVQNKILQTESAAKQEVAVSVMAGSAMQAGHSPVSVAAAERVSEREPMSRLRQRIAERLLESQQTTASLTTFNEVNMAAIMTMRKKYQEQFMADHGIKLGVMSFFVKAAVYALKKFPIVNASVDGGDIVYHRYYDIGVAISSPRGLVVPVIRDADRLSFAQIEQKIAEFSRKANDGSLSAEELSGGTFTVTNGGVFGSMLSTPIINPPQSAILGVHAVKDRPAVEDGVVVVRPMCYIALSYDHRIIDGRDSVQSLVAMKEVLEDPSRLLFE